MRAGIDYIGISAVFYCHDGKGNFLLHQRSDKCRDEQGRWDFGGGQLRFGETPEAGVLREIQEEYGVRGKIERQFPAHSLLRHDRGKTTHWLINNFLVRVDRRQVRINDPEKMIKIGWFPLKRLPKPLHSGARLSLKRYASIFSSLNF